MVSGELKSKESIMDKYVCQLCGYVYDEAKGIPEKGIVPGTKWNTLPADWKCPKCGAPKSMFKKKV
jgi:rubredoxin